MHAYYCLAHFPDCCCTSHCTVYCTVGPPECSIALQATAVTDTSITVMLMWTNCEGVESSTVSLSWFPEQNMCNIRYIGTLPANYEITNLVPSTNYTIVANFTDICGSVSAVVVAATLPSPSEYKLMHHMHLCMKCIMNLPSSISYVVVETVCMNSYYNLYLKYIVVV